MHGHITQRFTFRRLTADDIETWMEFVESAEAMEFFVPLYKVGDRTSCETWINKQLQRYEEFGHGLMALINNETSEFIGQCGLLKQEVDGIRELEIGFCIIPQYWGKGYAPEAAIACKEFAFANNMSDHIISIIHIDNEKSQSVAIKNGMEKWKTTSFKSWPVDIWRIDQSSSSIP